MDNTLEINKDTVNYFELTVKYYDGLTSKSVSCLCRFYCNGDIKIKAEGDDFQHLFPNSSENESESVPYQFRDLTILPPLGNMARQCQLPSGAMIEISNHHDFQPVLNHFKSDRGSFIHKIESNLWAIALSVIVVVLFTVFSVSYGVPFVSKTIARNLPDSIYHYMDDNLMQQFDAFVLEPSQISTSRQKQLIEKFQPVLDRYPNIPLQVHFRSQGDQANAFALPSGDMVFLDGLVQLAENDEELLAVLCHEIAHVYYRHGIQSTIQSSLLSWALIMMAGDITAGTELLVSIPAIIAGLSYSREMEIEADTFALALMNALDMDPIHFANVLDKMVNQGVEAHNHDHLTENDHVKTDTLEDSEAQKQNQLDTWLKLAERYLSTHPESSQRIERFRNSSSKP